MNIFRFVGLAVAALITATQWAALSSTLVHTQSVRAIAAPVADDLADDALPVIVVTAHHHLL
jgi:hypothetical protein